MTAGRTPMDRDLRQSPLFLEIERHFHNLHAPAFGRISGAADPAPSPDGRLIAFTGSKLERLEGRAATRVCVVNTAARSWPISTGGQWPISGLRSWPPAATPSCTPIHEAAADGARHLPKWSTVIWAG